MPRKAPLWVFTFAFFPLGIGGVALGSYALVRGIQSLEWPAAQAAVLSSRVSPRFIGAAQPEIRYSYQFDGKAYVSNRIWLGDVVSSLPLVLPSASRKVAAQFPQGASVEVKVNPKNPTDAALIAGPGRAGRWLAVFVFFLALGVWAPLRIKAD